MTEKPIIFSAPMVRAILAGRKTQTRRLLRFPAWATENGQPMATVLHNLQHVGGVAYYVDGAPRKTMTLRWAKGDRLWVKETHAWADQMAEGVEREDPVCVAYRADQTAIAHEHENVHYLDTTGWNWDRFKWRPSIYMPRWASRLTLEVTAVRVERLQDITELDALEEGVEGVTQNGRLNGVEGEYVAGPARDEFATLWDSINAKRATWASNPWVAVVEFKPVEARP